MRALSLHQPWASLIAYGFKRVETRDWDTNIRGVVAIQAAKKWDADQRDTWLDFRNSWEDVACCMPVELPLGAVVGVVELVESKRMTPEWIALQTLMERDFGAWVPGRYGFVLKNATLVDPAVPLTGRQGFFNVDLRDMMHAPQLLEAEAKVSELAAKRQGGMW